MFPPLQQTWALFYMCGGRLLVATRDYCHPFYSEAADQGAALRSAPEAMPGGTTTTATASGEEGGFRGEPPG